MSVCILTHTNWYFLKIYHLFTLLQINSLLLKKFKIQIGKAKMENFMKCLKKVKIWFSTDIFLNPLIFRVGISLKNISLYDFLCDTEIIRFLESITENCVRLVVGSWIYIPATRARLPPGYLPRKKKFPKKKGRRSMGFCNKLVHETSQTWLSIQCMQTNKFSCIFQIYRCMLIF